MSAGVPLRSSAGRREISGTAIVAVLVRPLLLLAAVSFLSLALVDLAPGDVLTDLQLNPRVSAETIERLRVHYGLDQPLGIRYGRWLLAAGSGDLGFSALYGSGVWPVLQPRLVNTVLLTAPATLVAWLLALPLGVWSAVRRGGGPDRVIAGGTSLLTATPDILLALLAMRLALSTGWFPAGGMTSVAADLDGLAYARDVLHHAALPVAALAAGLLPTLVRHVRASMIETLDSRFLLLGRALGVPPRRLVWRHALRVAAAPLSALVGLSVASLLSASLIVEVVMGWPGLGPLLVEATLARDPHLIAGATTVATAWLVAGVGLGASLGWLVDPRARQDVQP